MIIGTKNDFFSDIFPFLPGSDDMKGGWNWRTVPTQRQLTMSLLFAHDSSAEDWGYNS